MDKANSDILVSVASALLNGAMTAEDACKVLNTVAKFEERVANTPKDEHNQS